jgi:hypothetical protein
MSVRIVLAIVAALLLSAGAGHAETLPLSQGLIDLRSDQGEEPLRDGDALEAYVPLSASFVTQETQAFCGVASMVTVLNALGVPAPASPEYAPYRTFTQENLLDERSEAILPRATVLKQGMTLDELGRILALHPVEVEVHHAADSSLDAFRSAASEHLGEEGRAVIVNFLREGLGQERGGHHSPLAAYSAETDHFLILDVARYKYPPVWVSASRLFDAMNTPDHANADRTRGYVLIGATASGATKLN